MFDIHMSALDEQRFSIRTAKASNVGAADVTAVLKFCKEKFARMCIARCRADEYVAIANLEDNGFRLMDTLVVFCKRLRSQEIN
jgi:hypothetical protein